MQYLRSEYFLQALETCNYDLQETHKFIVENYDSKFTLKEVRRRVGRYKVRGLLPLDSGNKVSTGEVLKGTSTLYDDQNNVVLQWVKTDTDKTQQLDAIRQAISELTASLPALPISATPSTTADTLTLYLSNDAHIGALSWKPETGDDWNIDIATSTMRSAYDHLFATTPKSRYAIVADLGDLTEVDSYKNLTPHSGNLLDVDGRYPQILRAAYECLIYAIRLALTKHEIVYFVNVAGNHDITVGVAVREIIRAVFANEPRVIIDESPAAIHYHHFNEVLLQFAHGDGMKMKDAGEVMAHDCQDIFSETRFRYSHFG